MAGQLTSGGGGQIKICKTSRATFNTPAGHFWPVAPVLGTPAVHN